MNLTLYPALVLVTLTLILSSWFWLLAAKLVTRRPVDQIVRMFIYAYGRIWMFLARPFVRFSVMVDPAATAAGPAIIVSNHLSFFDIYCVAGLPFWNLAFVVRAWPFKMFWFAPFMHLAGYVNSEDLHADEFLAACSRILERGGSVMVYPEGHRSKDGTLKRFHSGAFKLATESGAAVIPVCITGTDRLLPPGSFLMRPARIRMRALAPVRPEQFQGPSAHQDMRRHVKERMAQTLAEMAA